MIDEDTKDLMDFLYKNNVALFGEKNVKINSETMMTVTVDGKDHKVWVEKRK